MLMNIQEAQIHQLPNTHTRPETRPDNVEPVDTNVQLGETALSFDGQVIDLRKIQIAKFDKKIREYEAEIRIIDECKSDGVAVSRPMTKSRYEQEIRRMQVRMAFLESSMEEDPEIAREAIAADLQARAEFDEFQRRMPAYMYRPPSDY